MKRVGGGKSAKRRPKDDLECAQTHLLFTIASVLHCERSLVTCSSSRHIPSPPEWSEYCGKNVTQFLCEEEVLRQRAERCALLSIF